MTAEEFIHEHRLDDVRQLALQSARYPGIDMPWALDQIRGWQMARHKLPAWAQTNGIIYPPHISMEQCSSEQTARYKAKQINHNQGTHPIHGSLIDLTGGFGVDFSYLAPLFEKAVYVERQQHLCDIARHNFQQLGFTNTEVVCSEAESFLSSLTASDITFFIDPARRSESGARTYGIADCTPDVCSLLPRLLQLGKQIMIKLSPMLDWREAVRQLNASAVCDGNVLGSVTEVHIVSVKNECKELLIIINKGIEAYSPIIFCVNDEKTLQINQTLQTHPIPPCEGEKKPKSWLRPHKGEELYVPTEAGWGGSAGRVGSFLLLPNASVMKAGCFDYLSQHFGIEQASSSSHIFFSDAPIEDFPGKQFNILASCTMNKKELRQAIDTVEDQLQCKLRQANVSVRNFPLTAVQLRQRLKLTDGGTVYVFGTTVGKDNHLIFFCVPNTTM